MLQYRTTYNSIKTTVQVESNKSSEADLKLRLVTVAFLVNQLTLKFLDGDRNSIWPSKKLILFELAYSSECTNPIPRLHSY